MAESAVFKEITPLSSEDCYILIERKKTHFNFPIHIHSECEINYVENAKGAQRIVGDSIEEIEDFDLVMISEPSLEHAWQNHECRSENIYEITIQFRSDFLTGSLLNKAQFKSIRNLLQTSKLGVAFQREDILNLRPLIKTLTQDTNTSFESFLNFLRLLNEMSKVKRIRQLASSSFVHTSESYDSRLITQIIKHLNENYKKPLLIEEVAATFHMSASTLARIIKRHTGKNFISVVNDIKVGAIARELIEYPDSPIAEIAFNNGFNNLSNFNRIFKSKKGCTPKEFVANYAKHKIVI